MAETLNINIPVRGLPQPLRLVAAFTLIGGLSIIGGLFVDIGRPEASVSIDFYILRLIIGIIAVTAAYSMIKKNNLAIWIYGFITPTAYYLNPITALIPCLVFIYLFSQKEIFGPSSFDEILTKAVAWLKSRPAEGK